MLEDKDAVLLNATIAKDGQWRFPFNEKVPKKFSDCITEFEDKRFYYHPGVDPIAFTRAFIKNMRNKGVPPGRKYNKHAGTSPCTKKQQT